MNDKIKRQDSDKITWITIDHPEKRNAFDKDMSQQVIAILNDAQRQAQRVVVINAIASHGIFSAGHDLNELTSIDDLQDDPMFEMIEHIRQLPIPVIAQVNGAVYAGALHLLMNCDLVYATTSAYIIMTANKMGLPFALPHYQQWLSVAGLHQVKELFFTADTMTAEDACHAGIFNAIFTTEVALLNKIHGVCEKIIQCSEAGIANSKLQLNQLAGNVTLNYVEAARIEAARDAILKSPAFRERVAHLLSTLHKES